LSEFPSLATEHALTALQDKHSILLTATGALAADWKRRFALSNPSDICQTPDILHWQSWLETLHQKHCETVPLLNMQELLLWQQVIGNDLLTHDTHLQTRNSAETKAAARELATHARQAYAVMQDYRIATDALAWQGEEAEALARWIEAIHVQLQQPGLQQRTLQAHITDEVLAKLAVSPGHRHETLLLDGFETLSPSRTRLLNKLAQAGCRIFTLKHDDLPPAPLSHTTLSHTALSHTALPFTDWSQAEPAVQFTALNDGREEIHFLAHRCQQILHQQPEAFIGIVIDDAFSTETLAEVMNESLMPQAGAALRPDMQAISMQGPPLSRWPMISQALHIMGLNSGQAVAFEDFSMLLFCPWLKDYSGERIARSTLDATLRQQQQHELQLDRLHQFNAARSVPGLLMVIDSIRQFSTLKSKHYPVDQWVQHIQAFLNELGLSQYLLNEDQKPCNHEIMQINALRDALLSLVAADSIESTLDWSSLFSLLQSACSRIRLTPTPLHPNVAVISRQQSAGIHFDYLLLPGMHEQSFPSAAKALTLLPLSLQRKLDIPFTHSHTCYAHARWLWQQWLSSGAFIDLSYARQVENQDVLPSPLLGDITPTAWTSTAISGVLSMPIETFDDAPDVPLLDENIRGGTGILTAQSACPFRAFASYRLKLKPLEQPEPGIDARIKGELIHAALEHIWMQLRTQAALAALSETERSTLITQAVQQAWLRCKAWVQPPSRQLESQRLQSLLEQWLNIELARAPFRVESIESLHSVELPFDPLPFDPISGSHGATARTFPVSYKIDRIDRDEQNRRILIDYKSGQKQSLSHWLGERPKEPQLPFYATASALADDDAVSFAHVQSGEQMGFNGLARENVGISGIKTCDGKRNNPEDWPLVLEQWRQSLQQLAEEFVTGHCTVTPRDAQACNHCGLEAVCRVGETGALNFAASDDANRDSTENQA